MLWLEPAFESLEGRGLPDTSHPLEVAFRGSTTPSLHLCSVPHLWLNCEKGSPVLL